MVETTQADEHEEKTFIQDPAQLDKFKAAALITNEALKKAVALCIPGADIHKICQDVDAYIEEEVKKVFASKKARKMERGIAFPCCISVNNIMGHYSPLVSETSSLAEGDVAKILCGGHIDGFAANAATTVYVGEGKATGRKADVVQAAHTAFQAALRQIREAGTNQKVTEAIAQAAAEFDCNPVEGVLSHRIKKHLIDGNDVIINKETATEQVEDWEFAPGDVIGLDVYVSSGEGKPKEAENRCTVYKRELETVYQLKMKSSRAFFVEVNKRFPTLPFALRAFEDQTGAKVGVKECSDHDMLIAYPVLQEVNGEFVAQFKATVVVLPRSTQVIAGDICFDASKFDSEKSIDNEEFKNMLAQPLWSKPKPEKK